MAMPSCDRGHAPASSRAARSPLGQGREQHRDAAAPFRSVRSRRAQNHIRIFRLRAIVRPGREQRKRQRERWQARAPLAQRPAGTGAWHRPQRRQDSNEPRSPMTGTTNSEKSSPYQKWSANCAAASSEASVRCTKAAAKAEQESIDPPRRTAPPASAPPPAGAPPRPDRAAPWRVLPGSSPSPRRRLRRAGASPPDRARPWPSRPGSSRRPRAASWPARRSRSSRTAPCWGSPARARSAGRAARTVRVGDSVARPRSAPPRI